MIQDLTPSPRGSQAADPLFAGVSYGRGRGFPPGTEERDRHDFRADLMPDGLDGDLDLEHVPSAKCGRSIVARAIIFFNTGDQVVDVAFPTCRPASIHGHRDAGRGRADTAGGSPQPLVDALDVGPLDLETDDLTRVPARAARREAPAGRRTAPCRG